MHVISRERRAKWETKHIQTARNLTEKAPRQDLKRLVVFDCFKTLSWPVWLTAVYVTVDEEEVCAWTHSHTAYTV